MLTNEKRLRASTSANDSTARWAEPGLVTRHCLTMRTIASTNSRIEPAAQAMQSMKSACRSSRRLQDGNGAKTLN